jgi:hypothetical protein
MTGDPPSKERLRQALQAKICAAESDTGYLPKAYLEAAFHPDPAAAINALLSAPPSEDSLQLWVRSRLDLTLEALVAAAPWSELLTPAARRTAQDRLSDWNAIQPMEVAAALVEGAGHPLYGVEETDWGE